MYIDTKLYYFTQINFINMEKYIKRAFRGRKVPASLLVELYTFLKAYTMPIRKPLISYDLKLRITVYSYNEAVGNPEAEAKKDFAIRLASLENIFFRELTLKAKKLREPFEREPSILAENIVCYHKEMGNTKEEATVDAIVRLFCLGFIKTEDYKRIVKPLIRRYYG